MWDIRIVLMATVVASDLSVAHVSFAQAPATMSFETASVRPSKSTDLKRGFHIAGEQLTATNVGIEDLIRVAYQLRIDDERLRGLPDWARTATYTIVAKAPAGMTLTLPNLVPDGRPPSTLALMVRALLAERFRLELHTERRSTPAYALVVARRDRKLGSNLVNCSALPDPTKCGIRSPGMRFVDDDGVSMALFVNMLTIMVERPVIDRTQLEGAYDIVLDYTPEPSFAQPVAPTAGGGTPDGPSVFTALEEQLGLKLESIRADVDMFVVDSVSQPEPN